MKDNGYNLSQIGKRMPYRTPEGFFGNLEEKVWEKVRADAAVEEANSGNIRRTPRDKLGCGSGDSHFPGIQPVAQQHAAGGDERYRIRLQQSLRRGPDLHAGNLQFGHIHELTF